MARRRIKRRASLRRNLVRLLFAGAACCIAAFAAVWLRLGHSLPDPGDTHRVHLEIPMRIYTADCVFIGEFGERRRWGVDYADVPQHVVDAFLAAEDHRFFEHGGVSIMGLSRAVWDLLRQGEFGSGGGTITMQVARNYVLSRDVTVLRKLKEILFSLVVEQSLSKEEILELYFNGIFFGNRAYGIGAAAAVLFGKPVQDLTIAEGALIAALPKAPSRLNPVRYPYRARERRNWILQRMRELEMITPAQASVALSSRVQVQSQGFQRDIDADYVAEMARMSVVQRFGRRAYRDGYRVFTTIDSATQTAANAALREGLRNYDRRHGWHSLGKVTQLFTAPVRRAIANADFSQIKVIPQLNRLGEVVREGGIFYPLREALRDYPQVADSQPAIVLREQGAKATLMTREGDLVDLQFSRQDTWARYSSPSGYLRAAPKSYRDIFAQGDIVYIRPSPSGIYQLDQIPQVDGALVSINAQNGEILAMVGGYDFARSAFNRAVQAKPQFGSVFKPFLYAAAISKGYSLLTEVLDAPFVITDDLLLEKDWRPKNDDGQFRGTMQLADAFAQSRNLVSIRLLDSIGVPEAIEFVKKFGFSSDSLPRNLSLALGTGGGSPLELAAAFAVITNSGERVLPYLVDRVEDPQGRVVWMQDRTAIPQPQMQGRNGTSFTASTATTAWYESMQTGQGQETRSASQFDLTLPPDPEFKVFDNLAGDYFDEWYISDDGYAALQNLADQKRNTGCSIDVSQAESEMGRSSMELLEASGQRVASFELEYRPRQRLIEPEVSWMTRRLLRGVVERGTGSKLKSIHRPDVIGKTGTSNDATSTWFAGSFGNLVTTVWVGFDDSRSLGAGEFGSTVALPIWKKYAETIEASHPPLVESIPLGIARVRVVGADGKDAYDTVLAQHADKIDHAIGTKEEQQKQLVKGVF